MFRPSVDVSYVCRALVFSWRCTRAVGSVEVVTSWVQVTTGVIGAKHNQAKGEIKTIEDSTPPSWIHPTQLTFLVWDGVVGTAVSILIQDR